MKAFSTGEVSHEARMGSLTMIVGVVLSKNFESD